MKNRPANTIRIGSRKNYPNSYSIWTSNDFFAENKELVFEHDEWGISFRIASIADTQTRKVYNNNEKSFVINVFDVNLIEGVLTLDEEESTQDQIFFNYQ